MRWLTILAVLSLGFAPVPFPKPDPGRDDLRRLRGGWEQVAGSLGGPIVPEADSSYAVELKGDRITFRNGEGVMARYTVTLDPTRRPRWLDMKDERGEFILGVYKLEGDTFTFCFRNEMNATDRPTDFEPKEGRGVPDLLAEEGLSVISLEDPPMRWLTILAVLSLGFAPVPFRKPESKKEDLEKLQGAWEQTAGSFGGPIVPETGSKNWIEFTGDRIGFRSGATLNTRWAVVLDPTKRPGWLDLRGERGEFILGIYKLEGDTFTFCFRNATDSPDRPTDFVPTAGRGIKVYRRKKG